MANVESSVLTVAIHYRTVYPGALSIFTFVVLTRLPQLTDRLFCCIKLRSEQ